MSYKTTLAQLLDSNDDALDEVNIEEVNNNNEDSNTIDPKLCVDCLQMPKEMLCLDCNEPFCKVCFQFAHRGGLRKKHNFKEEPSSEENGTNEGEHGDENEDEYEAKENGEELEMKKKEEINSSLLKNDPTLNNNHVKIMDKIKKNIKFIPMRLNYEERQLLKLLEAALTVSEYTDKVDILAYSSKSKRIINQLKEICSILAGLVVSSNIKLGKQLIENKNFVDNKDWYKNIFEIGRRYKIMNPERMRDTFGKLCYMIMDSMLPQIKDFMEFDFYKPILTIEKFIIENDEEKKSLLMFSDPMILEACADIQPENKSRGLINKLIKLKENAIEKLAGKYSSNRGGLSKDQIKNILYSVGDFNSYTNKNRLPVNNMIKNLEDYFKNPENEKFSLGIRYGKNGARLTHDHNKQFLYVKQALELWNHVMRDLIELWSLADDDLFNGDNYKLSDTGQGLQRIKTCPKLYKKMYSILNEVQLNFDYWVGVPIIHLGDDAVPNALFFLDKYIQIPSILIPIDKCIQEIEKLARSDKFINNYFEDQFESFQDLQKIILCDYFKHGFDGSGADNFYFAGSCVDASSTSSCEFCNTISKKPYFKVFLLTGFTNFNGEGY